MALLNEPSQHTRTHSRLRPDQHQGSTLFWQHTVQIISLQNTSVKTFQIPHTPSIMVDPQSCDLDKRSVSKIKDKRNEVKRETNKKDRRNEKNGTRCLQIKPIRENMTAL